MKILLKYRDKAREHDGKAAQYRQMEIYLPSEREAILAGKTPEQITDKEDRKLRDLDIRKELLPRMIAQEEKEAESVRDGARARILMVATEAATEIAKNHIPRWEARCLEVLIPAYGGNEGAARACLENLKQTVPAFVTLNCWQSAFSTISTQTVSESGIDAAVEQLAALAEQLKASAWAK